MTSSPEHLKEIVEYLHHWYEAFHKVLVFLGTISVSMLLFTVTFLLKDYLAGNFQQRVPVEYVLDLRRSLIFFGASLLFVFIGLLSTYNWFVTGIERAIRHFDTDARVLGEEFNYRSGMGSMWLWGRVSLISGWLAGLFQFLGVILYTLAAWRIIERIVR